MAATNRDLEAAVEAGKFRRDLFYRLQILEVHVPPLREHPEDLPELAHHFLERACQRLGRPSLHLTSEALRALTQYSWPGNVRELRSVMERAAVLSDELTLGPYDLHIHPLSSQAAPADGQWQPPYVPISLDELERHHILQTLSKTNWVIREAARILGINRSTLDRKLERFGLGELGDRGRDDPQTTACKPSGIPTPAMGTDETWVDVEGGGSVTVSLGNKPGDAMWQAVCDGATVCRYKPTGQQRSGPISGLDEIEYRFSWIDELGRNQEEVSWRPRGKKAPTSLQLWVSKIGNRDLVTALVARLVRDFCPNPAKSLEPAYERLFGREDRRKADEVIVRIGLKNKMFSGIRAVDVSGGRYDELISRFFSNA